MPELDPSLLHSLWIVLGLCWGGAFIAAIAHLVVLRLVALPFTRSSKPVVARIAKRWRSGIGGIGVVLLILAAVAGSAWATWLTFRDQVDAWARVKDLAAAVPPERWVALTAGLGRVAVAVVAALIASRLLTAILAWVHQKAASWSHLKAEPESVQAFFTQLGRLGKTFLWLLVATYAFGQLFLPEAASAVLQSAIIVYLIIAIGQLLARATAALIDTMDALSRTYLEKTSWLRWYDAVRPLIPLLRRCIEAAVWVGAASLALLQIGPIAGLAVYGPRIMQVIGIFFLARVAIEIVNLVITQRMILREDQDEQRAKRNATFAPLLRSLAKFAVGFVAGVLMLGALGFNPMPFLAGAGILGVVIGLGAQPMINDLVSGFFIIFENQFLVGDMIEVDGSRGTVEAIDFRTTRLRDLDGRVHVLRNGDLRRVINYSRDYSNAVVRIEVGAEADLGAVQAAFASADARLREAHAQDLLAAVEITPVEALDDGRVTTRSITRTRPGRHWGIAAEMRRLVLEEFATRDLVPAAPRRDLRTVA